MFQGHQIMGYQDQDNFHFEFFPFLSIFSPPTIQSNPLKFESLEKLKKY